MSVRERERVHLRAVEEPESAPVAEVLTATAELLTRSHTHTHTVNEMVDCFLLRLNELHYTPVLEETEEGGEEVRDSVGGRGRR